MLKVSPVAQIFQPQGFVAWQIQCTSHNYGYGLKTPQRDSRRRNISLLVIHLCISGKILQIQEVITMYVILKKDAENTPN